MSNNQQGQQGQGRRRRLNISTDNNPPDFYPPDESRIERSSSLSRHPMMHATQTFSQHQSHQQLNESTHVSQSTGIPPSTPRPATTTQDYQQHSYLSNYKQTAHGNNSYDNTFQDPINFTVTPDSRSLYVSAQQAAERNTSQNRAYDQMSFTQQNTSSPYAVSTRGLPANYNHGLYREIVTPEQVARYDHNILPTNNLYHTDISYQLNKKRNRSHTIQQGGEMLDMSPYAISQGQVQRQRTDVTPARNDDKRKRTTCRCVKSRCLKLYCDCFQLGVLCNSECQCVNCLNNEAELGPYGKLTLAREEYLIRKPNSFGQKPKKVGGRCACKNNRCLKKYCDCFNNGVFCSDKCQCIDCANQDFSIKKGAKKKKDDDSKQMMTQSR